MLKELKTLKVIANYIEEASRGVSQKTWDAMKEQERRAYLEKNPTSRYADPNNTLPTTIKNDNYKYQGLTPEMKKVLTYGLWDGSNIIENEDGSIDIPGNCDFNAYMDAEEFDAIFLDEDGHLKIKFNKVSVDFTLPENSKITSLEGCPKEVGGCFDCSECPNLESLIGCPKKVDEGFWCRHCGKEFTEDEIRKVCDVKGNIYTKNNIYLYH